MTVSFANSDPLFSGAIVPDDGAAPLEAALAPLRPLLPDDVVAPSAAQRLAVVQVVARLVAAAPRDAWIVDFRLPVTEIGRALVEEQIRLAQSTLELAAGALDSVTSSKFSR